MEHPTNRRDAVMDAKADELLERSAFRAIRDRVAQLPPHERAEMLAAIEQLGNYVAEHGVEGLSAIEKINIGTSSIAIGLSLVAWATGGSLLLVATAAASLSPILASPNVKTEIVARRLKSLAKELRR